MILCDLQESRLCQIEVLERGIAPPTVVIRESIVWGTEVGGGDNNGVTDAPLGFISAPHLVTCSTAQAIVE